MRDKQVTMTNEKVAMTALCHCEAQSAEAISRYNGAMTNKKVAMTNKGGC